LKIIRKIQVLLRRDDKPLQQIARRIHEIENSDHNLQNQYCNKELTILKNIHTDGPILKGCISQFTTMTLNGMKFQINNKGDNYCGIKEKFILIENICYNAELGGHIIIGKEFLEKTSLYSKPCSSVYLGIYQVNVGKLSKKVFGPLTK